MAHMTSGVTLWTAVCGNRREVDVLREAHENGQTVAEWLADAVDEANRQGLSVPRDEALAVLRDELEAGLRRALRRGLYIVLPVRDGGQHAMDTTLEGDPVWIGDDRDEAKEAAVQLSAGYCWGTAVARVGEGGGEIDWGGGQVDALSTRQARDLLRRVRG
jgi:hypothetical protein